LDLGKRKNKKDFRSRRRRRFPIGRRVGSGLRLNAEEGSSEGNANNNPTAAREREGVIDHHSKQTDLSLYFLPLLSCKIFKLFCSEERIASRIFSSLLPLLSSKFFL
jgi:hypothetical protein